jgi:predicted metal-dependent HD superfamily phosphohydrolase
MSNYLNIITAKLWRRWYNLLYFLGIEQDKIEKSFAQIVEAYSAKYRLYHTLEHIYNILVVIETLEHKTNKNAAIQLAAWFHDVIYKTQAQDNEEKSVEYAKKLLQSWGISNNFINTVSCLILDTKHCRSDFDDIESQILLDADLAILGANPEEYHKYARSIRQEYFWVSDADYIAGRTKVLEKFLQRDRIYLTEEIFNSLELSARNNIKAEIMLLKGGCNG